MKNYLFNHQNRYKYLVAFIDVCAIAAGTIVSYSIRILINQGHFNLDLLIDKFNVWQLLIVPLHIFCLYLFDLYNFDRIINSVRSAIKIIISVVLAAVIISGVYFFVPKYVFGRQVLVINTVVLSLVLVLWRQFILKVFSLKESGKKMALVCDKHTAESFINSLAELNVTEVKVAYVCSKDITDTGLKDGIEYFSSLERMLDEAKFDILGYYSAGQEFSNEEIRWMLETRQKNKEVFSITNFYANLTGKIPLELIDKHWMLNTQGLQGTVSIPYLQAKRLFDVFLSGCLLLVLSPLLLVIALVVKLESKGPAIYVQERLGRNRRPFKCYKFRTMLDSAEQETGPVWAEDEDPRLTGIGKILRATWLDELPQFWNILRGDISFVGPRPIRECFADLMSARIPFYELRFSVKPGLSGWAQVKFNYAGSEQGQVEKFKYELFYIQNLSLFLDLMVLFHTIRAFFRLQNKQS